MKILARQITVDMYDCKSKKLEDAKAMLGQLQEGVEALGYKIVKTEEQLDDKQDVIFLILEEGHIIIRNYPELKYVACDLFICQEKSKPEKAISFLRKLAKPEKIRMTYIKRGDFGTVKDVKPKTKVRVARLRQLRTKGAKVIKNVAKKMKVQK